MRMRKEKIILLFSFIILFMTTLEVKATRGTSIPYYSQINYQVISNRYESEYDFIDTSHILFENTLKKYKNEGGEYIKDERNGIMQIKIGSKSYFECSAYCANIGLKTMNDVKSKGGTREFNNLAIGIGYTRIQAYTSEVVNEKENKRRENNA